MDPCNHPRSSFRRRDALTFGFASVAALGCGGSLSSDAFAAPAEEGHCTLGFSTYGMKTLPVETTVREVAAIGFDSIEIAVRPDWDSAPSRMTPERRRIVRSMLDSTGLQLTSLMEHLIPSEQAAEHQLQLDRLEGVMQLANDLGGPNSPLVQTVLGGGQWEQKKSFLRDRVGDWLKVADRQDVVIAIKPHRGGAMSRPSEAVWLMQQLGHPKRLGMVYDFSHYAFRDMTLAQTVQTALPHTIHVAVKDAIQSEDRVVFDLPGAAGTIDFADLIRRFHAGGYRGDINCEVSGMVWSKPGYSPTDAARTCYANVAAAFNRAGIQRS